MLPEIVVDTPPNLAERLAARIEAEAGAALESRRRFSLALSGGSTAGALFPRLSRMALPWPQVDFFWCDERAVPPDDAESNYRLARSLWLDVVKAPAARIHRMKADAADREGAAASYAAEMTRLLGDPPRLDVALLGVGPDGHVASLFPNHPLLREQARWVAAIDDSPKPPASRLTLTLATLAAARLIVAAAFGEAKSGVVRDAIELQLPDLPLTQLLQRASRSIILLDQTAANLLVR